MEITSDIGKDTHGLLLKVVRMTGESIDVIAAEAMNIGARVLYSNAKDKGSKTDNTEEILKKIMTYCVQNSELSSEILSMNFDKKKSSLGAYDVETAIRMSEKIAKKAVRMSDIP